jgi:DNA modification methylase
MYKDLVMTLERCARSLPQLKLLLMDSRQTYPVEAESVDLAVTSPPYLNNYDYADRTRLELYFFGWAKSWGEITAQVRDKLIISATTQTRRGDFPDGLLTLDLQDLEPTLYRELRDKLTLLSQKRLEKGGKKTYDLMVAGYFNDMHQVIKQVYRVLKPGAVFAMVLGDSAPYGVHIPTEEYLGRLGLAYGFKSYQVQNLRKRGEKWKNNPQRHKVMLKEGVLLLQK